MKYNCIHRIEMELHTILKEYHCFLEPKNYKPSSIDLLEPKNCKPSSSIQPIQPGMTDYWLTHRPTHTPTQTTDLMTQTQTTQPSTQSEHRWIEEDENAVKWNWKDIYIAIYQVRWTAIYLQRWPHLPHLEPSTGYMHFPCGLNVWSTHVEPSIGYMYFRCGFERWSVIQIGVVLNVGVQYKLGV